MGMRGVCSARLCCKKGVLCSICARSLKRRLKRRLCVRVSTPELGLYMCYFGGTTEFYLYSIKKVWL